MLRWLMRVVVVVSFAVSPAFGQGGVAEVNGTVTDQTGSLLPGATITITEESTGLTRTVVSNETGRFVIPAVSPGRYTVRAELSGYKAPRIWAFVEEFPMTPSGKVQKFVLRDRFLAGDVRPI